MILLNSIDDFKYKNKYPHCDNEKNIPALFIIAIPIMR